MTILTLWNTMETSWRLATTKSFWHSDPNGPSWAELSTFGGWAVLTVLPTPKKYVDSRKLYEYEENYHFCNVKITIFQSWQHWVPNTSLRRKRG